MRQLCTHNPYNKRANPYFEALHHARTAMWMIECYQMTDSDIHKVMMGRVNKIAKRHGTPLLSICLHFFVFDLGVFFMMLDLTYTQFPFDDFA